ncbi:MAG: DUF3108 domain-containing protein [Pseudomonadota bacterium]
MLLLPAAVTADSLRAFNAKYQLYRGDMYVANSKLRLENADAHWRWRLSTRARGIYAMFTDKKPVSETTFAIDGDQIRLQQIRISDKSDKKKLETARFDWQTGLVDVSRKGKQKQHPLAEAVYDFQSIHWLATRMLEQQHENRRIKFYYKGKLIQSNFVYLGIESLKTADQQKKSHVFEQEISRSKSKITYYYDTDNPMLPLRIETRKSGESPTVMILESVEWL